uniref:Uncharacterized protein n=1 Tax=Panagrolaimus superbus TaxID=310955 RepID=A0A914YMA0_9BILA
MSDDIREAMKLIAAMKKTKSSKERITLEDLKRFLEVQEHLLRQPFVPYNVHIFKWIEDAVSLLFLLKSVLVHILNVVLIDNN